ncbi:MAG: hypothetical protein AWT59_1620 [Candidatus Gallionella acididurans]|uniref:Uncharacterized protein n=1 Tax=Candidatus Gallionella acididurans TaxID=1796491 RepID=A0A139BTN7_9PROT|nr:MAG: hypothetical protein AWT59_1620 [Candidatus Gallionella acididurans]
MPESEKAGRHPFLVPVVPVVAPVPPVAMIVSAAVIPATFISAAFVRMTFTPAPLVSVSAITGFILRRPDKIHGPVAGVVPAAISGPIPCVPRRHVHVNRFEHPSCRRLYDDRGLGVKNRGRRCVAELHLAIHTRTDLPAYAQVDDGRFRPGRQADGQKGGKDYRGEDFHDAPLGAISG